MSTIYVPDALQTWGLSLKTTWHLGTTMHIYRVGNCSCSMWASTRLRSNGAAIRTQIGLFSEFTFQSVSLLVLSAIEECWSLRVRGLCGCFSAWLTAGHRAYEDEETFTGAHSLIEWTAWEEKLTMLGDTQFNGDEHTMEWECGKGSFCRWKCHWEGG